MNGANIIITNENTKEIKTTIVYDKKFDLLRIKVNLKKNNGK